MLPTNKIFPEEMNPGNGQKTAILVCLHLPTLFLVGKICLFGLFSANFGLLDVLRGSKVLKCSEVSKYYVSRLKIKKQLMQYLNTSEAQYESDTPWDLTSDAKELPQPFW